MYIWLTAILLFVAFVFFAFAQAAVARNGAQSAADAAALAAAQDSRDELMDDLIDVLKNGHGKDDSWLDLLIGDNPKGSGAEAAARDLAADNDAGVIAFDPNVEVNGYPGYRVQVRTNYTVGDSIIPGTEAKHATADAVAVVKPRCDFDEKADGKKPVELDCDGDKFEIDPKHFDPAGLPDASDLFSVHLAE